MMISELFAKGGPVVWILAGYSLVALTIIVERLIHFALLGRVPTDFGKQARSALHVGTLGKLTARHRGPEVNVMRAVLEASGEGIRELSRVAERVGSQELQRMERGFRTLAILGNTAPLLGLFGTITGMIKAFMVIEAAGGRVDAQALAGGIWEAMVTTGVGLAVAIPVLLILHLLEGMADRRAQSMKACASLVLERLPHAPEADEEEDAVHHRDGGIHAF
ncbi:MotA/TolQ/ExbB proton channel family protein [Thiohalomonas denitrificans]|uniref:Biopolymer transport protein ExbB n=1 Tax=Thiohalomonas denitrificans TaxID=415747 RepID=A0A1G5QQV6_9GAMM|nr:MotA/TolQ/ExbB proton channel family protein [Thiohalomonas denitrificans]SCZ63671.1 biopolymer transport protein ExbB [Thiohalomonas denitrificans]